MILRAKHVHGCNKIVDMLLGICRAIVHVYVCRNLDIKGKRLIHNTVSKRMNRYFPVSVLLTSSVGVITPRRGWSSMGLTTIHGVASTPSRGVTHTTAIRRVVRMV